MDLPADIHVQEGAVVGVLPKNASGGAKLVIGSGAKIFANAVLYANNTIGDNFLLGACATVREENTIGNNVSVGSHADVQHHVVIEDDVAAASVNPIDEAEEGLETAEIHHFENRASHLLCVVDVDLDASVPLDASDRIDGDRAAHDGAPFSHAERVHFPRRKVGFCRNTGEAIA